MDTGMDTRGGERARSGKISLKSAPSESALSEIKFQSMHFRIGAICSTSEKKRTSLSRRAQVAHFVAAMSATSWASVERVKHANFTFVTICKYNEEFPQRVVNKIPGSTNVKNSVRAAQRGSQRSEPYRYEPHRNRHRYEIHRHGKSRTGKRNHVTV